MGNFSWNKKVMAECNVLGSLFCFKKAEVSAKKQFVISWL